jgi:hypothetical protein
MGSSNKPKDASQYRVEPLNPDIPRKAGIAFSTLGKIVNSYLTSIKTESGEANFSPLPSLLG